MFVKYKKSLLCCGQYRETLYLSITDLTPPFHYKDIGHVILPRFYATKSCRHRNGRLP